MPRPAQPPRLISAAEAERAYRLQHGSVRAAVVARALPGAERKGAGRHGRTLWVRPDDVERWLGLPASGNATP